MNRTKRIHVRGYSATDRRFLEQGLDHILTEKASSAPAHEIRPDKTWGRAYATSLLSFVRRSKGVGLIVEVDQVRAGFAFGAPDIGIPSWMLRSGRFSRRGSLLEVHVLPQFRRLGLASLLVTGIERHLRRSGCDLVIASYHQGHRFEANLYRSCGYSVNSVSMAKWLAKPPRE